MRHKVTSYLNQLSEKVNQRSEAILTQHSVKFEKKGMSQKIRRVLQIYPHHLL